MSYFDDQEEAWYENDCQGSPSDYDPFDPDSWPKSNKKRPQPVTRHKTSKNLLAVSQLEEFATWAVADGFTREATKGEYEILRLRWPKHPPYLFFKRSTACGNPAPHATCQGEATQLVKRWFRERDKSSSALK